MRSNSVSSDAKYDIGVALLAGERPGPGYILNLNPHGSFVTRYWELVKATRPIVDQTPATIALTVTGVRQTIIAPFPRCSADRIIQLRLDCLESLT